MPEKGKMMGYSSLATQIKPPKHSKWSSRGGAKVGRVIVHHWAGTAGGVERLVESTDKASANYIILSDGTIIGSVDETYRAWTSGSQSADASSITVEVQNAETRNYTVTDKALESLIALIADVATRYGFTPSRETVRGHREFSSTSCPGPYLWPMVDDGSLAARAVAVMGGSSASAPAPVAPTTAKKNASTVSEFDEKVLAYQKRQNEYADAGLLEDGIRGTQTKKWEAWVEVFQTELKKWKGVSPSMPVDRDYGPNTNANVKIVQKRNNLRPVDGIAGEGTTLPFMRKHGSNIPIRPNVS